MEIQADPGNTGAIYLGDVTVAANKCLKLSAKDVAIFNVDTSVDDEVNDYIDLKDVYIDGATTGDKVNVIYLALTSVSYNA